MKNINAAKSSANAVEVKNLVKRYKNAKENAVDGVSFDVKSGEFFTLLGPNGAGKTTTISMLTTTLASTGGSIKIAGYDAQKEPSKVRSRIGIIFQNQSLDINLTAEENIRLHCILYGLYPFRPTYGMMPQSYKERVSELASVLGIQNEIHKKVKTFSGGMKRKLEIVRSLMHKPKVLFLDEPTSGLDPLSRRSLWEYLTEVRKTSGTTIFLTTHYLEEAEDADRVCIINHGKVIYLGTPDQMKKNLQHQYLVVDTKDKSALKKELAAKKLKFTGSGPVEVDITDQNAQTVIQKIKTPLTRLDIHHPSVEEAYLEIVMESKEKEDEKHAGN